MKTLLKTTFLMLSMALSPLAFATDGYHYVDATYHHGDKPFVAMTMTIKNRKAIDTIREQFPYDDCYQGVCTYSSTSPYGYLVINFTAQNTEKAWARGRNASYLLSITESGPNLLIKDENKSVSWQFKP